MAKAELTVLTNAISGSAGNVTFVEGKEGTIVRSRTRPKNPSTPAQQAVRAAFTKCTRLWSGFTTAQIQAWEKWASKTTEHDEVTGKGFKSTGFNAFVKLAAKYLQVNPSGTVPTAPPSTPFGGDVVAFTVTAGTGKLTFTADKANAAGVTTELLIQPLVNKNRKPGKAYKSAGFFTFTSGSLSRDVAVPAGWYAAAYRFVMSATGQDTQVQTLAVHQVTFAVEQGGTQKKAA